MKGYWKLNWVLGLAAALLTFAFSFLNNTWLTALIRSVIGFLCFFVLGFIVQLVLKQSLVLEKQSNIQQSRGEVKWKEDLEQGITEEPSNEPFQAIPLQSLHIGEEAAVSPDKIAKTISKWTSQNRRSND